MSNGCKSRKAELVAIYRLEFYKKQKNWKLLRETRKKPEKAKKLLNQTYNVEKPKTGSESLLNKAFLETGADQNKYSTDQIDSNSPTSSKSEKDWSDPVKGQKDWSDPVKDPPPDPEPVPTKPKKMTIAERIKLLISESSESKPETNQLWSEAVDSPDLDINSVENNKYDPQNIWLQPEKEPYSPEGVQWSNWPTTIWSDGETWPQSTRNWPEPVGWDLGYQGGRPRYAELETDRLGYGCDKGRCEDTEAWINDAQILPEDISAEELPLEWEKLATDGTEWLREKELPEDLLRLLLDQEQRCEKTLDSSTWSSFMRGANNAPHSSETELQVPSVSGSVEEPGGELGALSPLLLPPVPPLSSFSTIALQAHASRCARALREALRETRARTRVSQSSLFVEPCSPPRYSSGSDEPTRDVGLDGPPGPTLLRKSLPSSDAFIAGSHCNNPAVDLGDLVPQGRQDPLFLGRGRGRLSESTFHLSVGRGRGRPYVKI